MSLFRLNASHFCRKSTYIFAVPRCAISFFKKGKQGEDAEKLSENDRGNRDRKMSQAESRLSTKHNLSLLKTHRSLDTKRGYKPPSHARQVILDIVGPMLSSYSAASANHDASLATKKNLASASLSDPKLKYKIVSRLIKEFDHDMPNTVLTSVQNLEDVIIFFETEVRQTSKYEDLSKLDLPPNLHIQQEYVRFNPDDKDAYHQGRTAFPGRDTIVTSIKYKRKYSDIITTKPKPGYVNHYYGY